MEVVPTQQDLLKSEPSHSTEQLSRKTQTTVLENGCDQVNCTGTIPFNSQHDKSTTMHECVHCGKVFKRKFDLKRHQKRIHPEASLSTEDEIKKSASGRTFKVYGILQAVLQPVSIQEKVKVEPVVSDKLVERLHEATVHDDGHNPCDDVPDKTRQWHMCLQCGNAFTRKFDLKRHQKSLHPVVEKSLSDAINESGSKLVLKAKTRPCGRTFKCKVCERLFTRKSDVQRHVLRIHTKIALLECKVCLKKFCEKAELAAHKCIHRGFRPYECEVCMKKFRQKSALNIHTRTHTGEKPYRCEVCMKSFSQTSVLLQHLRVHTGEKPFQCGTCLKTFSEMSNLHKHTRIHTGEKPFQCEICMKKFSLKSVLNQHKRIHTGEKPYECEICLKRFNKKSVVNQHKRVHTGEKPYQCEMCVKKFSEKSALDRHRLVHTGEKPYECETCLKKFKEKSVLNKHRCVPVKLLPNHISENSFNKDLAKGVVLKTYSKFQQSLKAAFT